MKNWTNYGDINPIEHGGMFVKHDDAIQGRCYYVISLVPFEDKWLVIDGWVDLNSDWIDYDAIKETMDTPKNADDEYLATDVMHYYGSELGDEFIIETEQELNEFLVLRQIEME